jgi:uncharacterized membrane protein
MLVYFVIAIIAVWSQNPSSVILIAAIVFSYFVFNGNYFFSVRFLQKASGWHRCQAWRMAVVLAL